MVRFRSLKKLAACAILLALLAGAVSPKVGDFIELQRALTGLSSDDFSDAEANARFIIEAHALASIDKVKPLVGGTYGLLVTVRTGTHRGEQAWIDYNPARGYISLCAVDLDSCPVARQLIEAHAVKTEVPMPALPASDANATATDEPDPWANPAPPPSRVATVSAGFVPQVDDAPPPREVVPVPGNSRDRYRDRYDEEAMRWVNRHLNDPAEVTDAPELACGGHSAPSPQEAFQRRDCYNLSPGAMRRFQSNPDYRGLNGRARKQAFLDYIGPIAVQVQRYTRIPASVLIAQAAVESGWSTSRLAVSGHNLFGISCFSPGQEIKYPVQEYGDHGKWDYTVGFCSRAFPRPGGEGGYYVVFRHTFESVYAYASTLLASGNFPGVRAAIARTPAGHLVSWREVLGASGGYATKNDYASDVATRIRVERLDWYDHIQLCEP